MQKGRMASKWFFFVNIHKSGIVTCEYGFTMLDVLPIDADRSSHKPHTQEELFMKKWIFRVIVAGIALNLAAIEAYAAKKNDPDDDEVEEILKDVGGDHMVEDMKINDLCSLEFENEETDEEVFYHIYVGTLRKGGYHLIVFDNKPEYLGYYRTNFEPAEYGEYEIMLDSGESDEDGNTTWYTVPFTIKGPADKIRIDGTPVSFIKNPKREDEAKKKSGGNDSTKLVVPEKEKSASGEIIDYRDWTITMKGKQITVSAKFEKIEDGKVYIKNAKNGVVAGVPGSALSAEDVEYVKRITAQ